MMGLPALLKRSGVGAKLERAEAELAKCDAAIIELRAKLSALDPEADDFATTAQALNAQISLAEKSVSILIIQIAGLEHKVGVEQAAEKERRRQAAIKVVEAMLPDREKIVGEIEAAIKALPSLFQKLSAWRAKFVRQYPIADVEFPYAHFIDSDRVLRIVVEALRNIRAEDFHERIDGLAASEVKQHEALIADLRGGSPDPARNSEAA